MKSPRIELPTSQNWSCHGCTDCCRDQFLITISAGEKKRIEQQQWSQADGVDPDELILPQGNGFRLAHQINGACVFLDDGGRCRIHARFGEAAKPLACRLYPLVIHPAGGKLVVGLRFSCPSAATNRGSPMSEQRSEVQKLVDLILPKDYEEGSPPPVLTASGGEWPDFLRFIRWLDTAMAGENVPTALKLLRALHWLKSVEKGALDQITGSGADEILDALTKNAADKVSRLPEGFPRPSRFGRLFLRMLVLEHARVVTVEDMSDAGRYRGEMLRAIFRLLLPGGSAPALRNGLNRIKFDIIENSTWLLPQEADAVLSRFFRVKIQSIHFCGRAFHDRPLIEGFRSLALLYPVIVWLSRWLAASDGRTNLGESDISRAISMLRAKAPES